MTEVWRLDETWDLRGVAWVWKLDEERRLKIWRDWKMKNGDLMRLGESWVWKLDKVGDKRLNLIRLEAREIIKLETRELTIIMMKYMQHCCIHKYYSKHWKNHFGGFCLTTQLKALVASPVVRWKNGHIIVRRRY